MSKERFDVTGMTCSACSSRVEKSVSKLPGTKEISVNVLTGSMQVEFDDSQVSAEDIIQAVEHAGYGASLKNDATKQKSVTNNGKDSVANHMEAELKEMKFRLLVSFLCLIPLMYVSMGHMVNLPLPGFLSGHENAVSFAFTQFLLCLPVLYVNRVFFSKGFKNLFHGAPNMDSLIAIGSGASLVYGVFAIYRLSYGLGHMDMDLVKHYHMELYFESAAMILALITLGKYLETRSKGKTSEAIQKLMNLAPKTAVVERDGMQVEVPVEEVVVGDVVVVKPGQSIPVDGVIIEGTTSVDEAAITGESIPVEKEVGSTVIAATINKAGFVRIKANKVGDDTTFSQIIKLVEEASSSKAPIAKMADKISGIFVPTVIVIAIVSMVVWLLLGKDFEFALSIAISILVISCPCALGLATPVAIMVGTGKGAEHGILIKSGEALEIAHSIDTVVLDKTGTITMGKPQVTDIYLMDRSRKQEEVLGIVSSLEAMSEHPLAEAIVEYANEKHIPSVKVEDFSSIPGKGVEGKVAGKQYLIGNKRLMDERNISISSGEQQVSAYAKEGKTPLLIAEDGKLITMIAVADVVKPTSKRAIESLKQLGIKVIMLTGDNKNTAEAIQKQLDIDTVIAEVLPSDKESKVASLMSEGKKVAMVGDGVNDAPALARADVGLAIGAGTDVAIESADIVLMKNDLMDVVTAIKLSKAVIRNIKENLFWAFFYNTIGIPLAAGVFYTALGWKLSPMFGAAAMSLSSVCVVSNALRLKLFKVENAKVSEIEESKVIESKQVMEEEKMVTVKINGMSCGHCKAHVEKALATLPLSNVVVDLESNTATFTENGDVTEEQIKAVITDAGYEVVDISRA